VARRTDLRILAFPEFPTCSKTLMQVWSLLPNNASLINMSLDVVAVSAFVFARCLHGAHQWRMWPSGPFTPLRREDVLAGGAYATAGDFVELVFVIDLLGRSSDVAHVRSITTLVF
jgi:hypothetical protein